MTFKIDRDWALFYGTLIGDGCISACQGSKFVVITCSLIDDKTFIDEIVVPLTEKLRGKPVKYQMRHKYGKIEINFSDKALFGKLESLGFPVGKKGDIEIPASFPRKLWKYIIAGIFATDGSIVFANNNGVLYPRIEVQSISSKLLYQIRDFLIENGLWGHVYKINARPGVIYRLEFPGKKNLVKFRNKIGFINQKHEKKFHTYLERTQF